MDLFACEGEEHTYGGDAGTRLSAIAIAHMRAHTGSARENSTRLGHGCAAADSDSDRDRPGAAPGGGSHGRDGKRQRTSR